MIQKMRFKISGMHCGSCAMNIDGELEDTGKVVSVKTSYSKTETVVEFDPAIISEEEIKTIIQKGGYVAEKVSE
jgi:Cu+-exporting ATPase